MIVPYNGSRKTRGFTLTEVAIVMGVVGLILGGIWIAAAAVYTNHRVNTAYTQVMRIVQGTRALYASQALFPVSQQGTNITNNLKQAGIIPKDMINEEVGVGVKNPWSTGTRVYATTTRNGFAIFLRRIPQSACIQLVSKVAGPGGTDVGLHNMPGFANKLARADAVGDWPVPDVSSLGSAVDEAGVAPTPNATGCTNAVDNDGNFIGFGFKL